MEKLIETRGQYNAIRSRVLANVWTIENVRDLLGRSCIKEEYEKYIRTLYALKKLFTFSKCEKEEEFNRLFNDGFGFKDEETKKLARKYVEERKKRTGRGRRKSSGKHSIQIKQPKRSAMAVCRERPSGTDDGRSNEKIKIKTILIRRKEKIIWQQYRKKKEM